MQTAFYLATFAAVAIVLALTLNWRNDRNGLWVNVGRWSASPTFLSFCSS